MLDHRHLKETDEKLYNLILMETERQKKYIELIASESYVSVPVLQASVSILHNKHGSENSGSLEKIEKLCKKRVLQFFNLDENTWGVNVRPYSGTVGNFEIYNALIDRAGSLWGWIYIQVGISVMT